METKEHLGDGITDRGQGAWSRQRRKLWLWVRERKAHERRVWAADLGVPSNARRILTPVNHLSGSLCVRALPTP